MARRPFRKRLLSSPIFHVFMPFIVSVLLRLIYVCARIEKRIPPASEPYLNGEKPAVFCFWHGRMIMHLMIKPKNRPMFVLSSRHNDGALIVATMRQFGIGTVRGSSNFGSAKALRELLKVTEVGGNISFTPDGPRGPFQQAAHGAAFVATKTNYPLLPITFSATRHKRLRSWDRFMIPLLFSRIVFVADEPIFVAANDDISIRSATETLAASLNRITNKADTLCGVNL